MPALPVPRPKPSLVPAALSQAATSPSPGSPEVRTAAIPAVVLRSGLPTDPGAPLPSGMRRTIVIDPGHGGIDPGTIGVDGIEEKSVVLAMAKDLRTVLEATGRYHVALTRNGDTFIPLRDRIRIAREAGGQLFISLHADSIAKPHFRGASVYTLSDTASDAEAELLASKENKADIITGTDLSNHDPVVTSILIDLAQRNTSNRSIAFADLLSARLGEVTHLVRKHRRFAGFAVLKSPDLPSVLIELGYLSSHEDAVELVREDWRNRMSRAILTAIDRFFQPPHS
jgi:N-acetylmuramoyl-L-alanine amidase